MRRAGERADPSGMAATSTADAPDSHDWGPIDAPAAIAMGTLCAAGAALLAVVLARIAFLRWRERRLRREAAVAAFIGPRLPMNDHV